MIVKTQHSTWPGSENDKMIYISHEVRGGYYYITWKLK